MTRLELRWAARTIREVAIYYGLGSGSAIRRGVEGSMLARLLCCRLLRGMGLSYQDVGAAMRLSPGNAEEDVRLLRCLAKKHPSLRRDMDAIDFEAVAWEVGFDGDRW